MRRHFLGLLIFALMQGAAWAGLKVITLHPLLGDVARQVGGEQVEVIDLMSQQDDPHHFNLRAAELRRTDGADVFLASGKGLETFLPKLRQNLPEGAQLWSVGDWVPSIQTTEQCNHEGHDHEGHDHGHLVDDPHWWHGIGQMRRVVLRLGVEFGKLDPAHAADYRKNASAYAKELGELLNWAQKELSVVDPSARILASSHAAFGYFCEEFQFEALPVQGLTADRAPSVDRLREMSRQLGEKKVLAVFPEAGVNPKTLKALAKASGVKIGGQLNGDGMAESYVAFIRHNVETIVLGLTN